MPPFRTKLTTPLPALASLRTLNPLQGRISVIHASSLFHLFNEVKQRELARALGSLLSPEPGSVIFGAHGGRPEKGFYIEKYRGNPNGVTMFCHGPQSWKDLWGKDVFKAGQVAVSASLRELPGTDLDEGEKFYMMIWSVTRV